MGVPAAERERHTCLSGPRGQLTQEQGGPEPAGPPAGRREPVSLGGERAIGEKTDPLLLKSPPPPLSQILQDA